MAEKRDRFISGLTLGVICLVLNISLPLIAATLNENVEAPGYFASGLVGEMCSWFGDLGLGWQILMVIPLFVGSLVVLILAVIAVIFMWLLKTAAVTKTLAVVAFFVGYTFGIPPVSFLQGLGRMLAGIGMFLFGLIIEPVLSGAHRAITRSGSSRRAGGLVMADRNGEPESDSGDTPVFKVKGDSTLEEHRKLNEAAGGLISAFLYERGVKRRTKMMKSARELADEERLSIKTLTGKLQDIQDFIKTGRRSLEIDEILKGESQTRSADTKATIAESDARAAEANLRRAQAEQKMEELGKPRKKESEAERKKADVQQKTDMVQATREMAAVIATLMAEEEKKAAQGDPAAAIAAQQYRRLLDDLATGEL